MQDRGTLECGVNETVPGFGLVDDAACAGQWVRSRHPYRGLVQRAIAVELRRKGVADGVAKEALAEVDPDSAGARLVSLAEAVRHLPSAEVPEALVRAVLTGKPLKWNDLSPDRAPAGTAALLAGTKQASAAIGVIGAVVWSLLLANGFDVEEFLREIEQGR